MRRFNRQIGRLGEDAAAELLVKKGFEMVLRNYSTRYGEIDLICRDKDVLVFVEVKTKKGLLFGQPEEMFTRKKYERVKRMAQGYLGGKEVPCRIDMVAVILNHEEQALLIKHFQNVYF